MSDELEKAANEILWYHGCATGDCPHLIANDCFKEFIKAGARWQAEQDKEAISVLTKTIETVTKGNSVLYEQAQRAKALVEALADLYFCALADAGLSDDDILCDSSAFGVAKQALQTYRGEK